MFQLALGHVVLWLHCNVLSKWVLRCCSQPLLNTIIVAFLWLSIISSDIVFEVETYKYKAVAQLIKTLPADCWIHSFMIVRRMSLPAATDQGVRSVSSISIIFHHQKLCKHNLRLWLAPQVTESCANRAGRPSWPESPKRLWTCGQLLENRAERNYTFRQ